MKVRFTATSFAEINEIHDHIAKDNPTAAKAVILRVEQVIARIARFRSSPAQSIRQACASFPWGRFLILSSILLRPMR
jgi:plasmid stabilization system protein ParE